MLTAASALTFGLLGWTVAHGLSTWLFGHCHVAGASPEVWRLDHHAGEVALLAACLALGSLLALLAVPNRGRPQSFSRKQAVRLSALLSTGAFIATDFTERAVAGEYPVPPLMVLLIGLLVYALIGAGASLLWQCCLNAVQGVMRLLEYGRAHAPYRRSAVTGGSAGFARRCAARVHAGRSPPLPA